MSIRRLGQVLLEEVGAQSGRLWLLNTLPRLFPDGTAGRIRARLYRILGIPVGAGTLVMGAMTFGVGSAPAHVRVGKRCFINRAVYLDAAAPVVIGDGVSLGHHVTIVTSDHAIGPPGFRAGAITPSTVQLGDGCWVAAGALILPGVHVGAGAVVAAGAVVTRDVAAHTLVGGVPARIIRHLDQDSQSDVATAATSVQSGKPDTEVVRGGV